MERCFSPIEQNFASPSIVFAAACARLGNGIAMPQATLESQTRPDSTIWRRRATIPKAWLTSLRESLSSGPKKRSSFYPWAKFPASTRTKADSLRDQSNYFTVTTSEFHDIQQRVASLIANLTRPVRRDSRKPPGVTPPDCHNLTSDSAYSRLMPATGQPCSPNCGFPCCRRE